MFDEEEEHLIILPTRQTPPLEAPERNLYAVVVITQSRASEILQQMEEARKLTARWEGVFQLACYDTGIFFVPPGCVDPAPEPERFAIFDPDTFRTPDTVRIVRPHVNVIPAGSVIWSALDPEGRFQVSTIEVSRDVLEALALGGLLQPGDSHNALNYVMPIAESMVVRDGTLKEVVM